MSGIPSTTLHQIISAAGNSLLSALQSIEAGTALLDRETLARRVRMAMDTSLRLLDSTGLRGTENRQPSAEFWSAVEVPMGQGGLQRHAREKPHGYPGDFEMLERICQDDRGGSGLAWALDDYFQRQAAPQAVRNRSRIVAEEIVALCKDRDVGPLHIVSFGSGPGFDLRSACQSLEPATRQRVRLQLVDLDPHALDFAANELLTCLDREQVVTHRLNLKRFASQTEVHRQLAGAHLVSCPGFLDYLEATEAAPLLERMWNLLAEGGKLIAFNFADGNPSRAYMEWVGNWYLKYRTADDMRKLAADSGLPTASTIVGIEPAGVNLFIRASHPG